ncbi:tRNA guanosine(34) transglycosylase Tgt [Candidatus Woesearchaeota archaeon]|nr:tRNA guanosine(34) transglycosylase Tgt [Candidatus Woesearchaeota archaeon]
MRKRLGEKKGEKRGNLGFRILVTDPECRARAGLLRLKHGTIETPAFMPVATKATVKTLSSEDMESLGAQILMCNTYHLHLQPGEQVVKRLGGLHSFMDWKKPIITDSAGFQAFSLGYGIEHFTGKIGSYFIGDDELGRKKGHVAKKLAHVDEEGVRFNSIYNNEVRHLTPEKSIAIQKALGADIIIAFDECTSPYSDHDYTKQSMERTHRWAERSLKAHKRNRKHQSLFGVIQGGYYEDLRRESARFISSLSFDGICVGGSLGRSKDDMHRILDWVHEEISGSKGSSVRPVHLLGIGTVEDIFESVQRGIDLFDCVGPTRIARCGYVYITPKSGGTKKNKFRFKITNSKFENDRVPIDKTCSCPVCKRHSRSYIRHLFKSREYLAYRLTTIHNLHFMLQLMEDIRESIRIGKFLQLKKKWLGR